MAESQTPFARAELSVRAVEWKEITPGSPGTDPLKSFATRAAMPVAAALFRAVQKTLEVMFFVDVVSHGDAENPAGQLANPVSGPDPQTKLWVEVCFEGSRTGCVRLGLHPTLALYCHEGFQPDDQPPGDDFDFDQSPPAEPAALRALSLQPGTAAEQSLLELGNIVCGAFLSNAWPQGLFRVKEPAIIGSGNAPSADAARTLGVCCDCQTTEGPVEARAYFDQEALPNDA
jgi:hypothetical protein